MGGNLFLISDAVLFVREALLTAGTPAARVADAAVMGTYTVAQLLLIDGLFPRTHH
ncbi:lysoplasmalogenase family protein [Corynebacterium efficiens]|nr:lysoplasmalogenase family protein [Corynebacterium efficiens]